MPRHLLTNVNVREVLPPFQGLGILWTIDPGRRSRARFALGYCLSGFQPFLVRRLTRFNELRETLQLRLSGEFKRFADEELRAVLTLLAGSTLRWIADGRFQISNSAA